jgi:hypothetical protein
MEVDKRKMTAREPGKLKNRISLKARIFNSTKIMNLML